MKSLPCVGHGSDCQYGLQTASLFPRDLNLTTRNHLFLKKIHHQEKFMTQKSLYLLLNLYAPPSATRGKVDSRYKFQPVREGVKLLVFLLFSQLNIRHFFLNEKVINLDFVIFLLVVVQLIKSAMILHFVFPQNLLHICCLLYVGC